MCQRLSEGERRGGGSDYRLPALAAQQPADSWLIKKNGGGGGFDPPVLRLKTLRFSGSRLIISVEFD